MKHSATTPAALVIFGVTGDLAQHMLLPALYHLESEGLLPEKFAIVGIFRREPDVTEIIQEAEIQLLRSHSEVDLDVLEKLKARIHAVKMDSTNPDHFKLLSAKLRELDKLAGVKLNHLFYL